MNQKSYNEAEFMEAILQIMERVRKKYNFAAMDGDDVAQEAFIIGLKIMEKYDKSRGPIVNFLSLSIGNRIKNLMRDKLTKEVDTCSLDNIQDEYETIGNARTTSSEFWEMVDEHLHPSFRKDYIKLRQGMQVPKLRKQKIVEAIRKIVDESL